MPSSHCPPTEKPTAPASTKTFLLKGSLSIVTFYALILTGLFYDAYTVMLSFWHRADYNYCYLIPGIVLYLIWEDRLKWMAIPSQPSYQGFWMIGIGLGLFWLGELGGEFFTLYLASWCLVYGLLWLHWGFHKLKIIWFPLFFLLTMFPPPNFIYNKLSMHLKLISSQLGVMIMQAYGMSVFREGNIIDLGFTRLQVVDACSGLRYLLPLFVMSILLAYFYRAHRIQKLLIVVSAIPLSIITNSLRIALTGILSEVWSKDAAHGFFHGFSGWFIFMFSLGVMLAEMGLLKKIFIPKGLLQDTSRLAEPSSHQTGIPMALSTSPRRNWSAPFVICIALLSGTLALAHFIDFNENSPHRQPFSEFPRQVGSYLGTHQALDPVFIDELNFSDYLVMNFETGDGNTVQPPINLYMAYYASQRKGESIHSPATCLPGSGWIFQDQGPLPLERASYPPMHIKRALLQKGATKQMVYYWFPQRGRVLTHITQLKFFTFWDALTRRRTDGALVRLMTPIAPTEPPKEAEKRLQAFLEPLLPLLNDYIPD